MNFMYNLSETEYLVFKTQLSCIELFSGYEGSGELKKIANYKGGKWVFDSFDQKKLFWFLFSMFKVQFGKALKAYMRSLDEKPKIYVIQCAKRRFDIKIQRMKKNCWGWIYNTFYGYRY